MTPEREKYLAKIGKKEEVLRELIATTKALIRASKKSLNLNGEPCFFKKIIKEAKIELTAYYHERARLKGMDNVVVPKEITKHVHFNIGYAVCKCNNMILLHQKYCSSCGKRILWEKVK